MVVFYASCTNSNNETKALKKQIIALKQEIDSLKNAPSNNNSAIDSVSKNKKADVDKKIPSSNTIRTGKHAFTLQWISWDEPGSVMIQPANDGWYSIKGEQRSRRNSDYITIEGLIRKISPTELQFKGEIKSVVETNNGGDPCIKTGIQIFKTTQNRKYWRLQDMINCEGGMLTDYVDIYFD